MASSLCPDPSLGARCCWSSAPLPRGLRVSSSTPGVWRLRCRILLWLLSLCSHPQHFSGHEVQKVPLVSCREASSSSRRENFSAGVQPSIHGKMIGHLILPLCFPVLSVPGIWHIAHLGQTSAGFGRQSLNKRDLCCCWYK